VPRIAATAAGAAFQTFNHSPQHRYPGNFLHCGHIARRPLNGGFLFVFVHFKALNG
jgi:hypothetical protein